MLDSNEVLRSFLRSGRETIVTLLAVSGTYSLGADDTETFGSTLIYSWTPPPERKDGRWRLVNTIIFVCAIDWVLDLAVGG
jgi:hypothetical protein